LHDEDAERFSSQVALGASRFLIATPLHPHTWRNHLRRRFPLRFKELQRAGSPEDVKKILARTTATDVTYNHLKKYPEEMLRGVFGQSQADE
jgi:hypothetical protein